MNKLLEIMSALREPESGCPWDIKQTFKSLVPYTLEEAYEVADAIENDNMSELQSELGDLLYQVVFYAQMAKEQGVFDFNDVVDGISHKLISRHPHVFENQKYKDKTQLDNAHLSEVRLNDAQLNDAWEMAKSNERDNNATNNKASVLDGVAMALPALKRAQKLQKRAARVGFDWPDIEPVINKIEEEIIELREAIKQQDRPNIFEETGDLLFSCVNLARHLDVDAEESLRAGNHKFQQRFNFIETELKEKQLDFKDCSLNELEALWNKAKLNTFV